MEFKILFRYVENAEIEDRAELIPTLIHPTVSKSVIFVLFASARGQFLILFKFGTDGTSGILF